MRTRLQVKEVANKKGISLTKLSQRSEVAYNTVRRIWREPYTDVTLSTLQRLADVLGVDVSELVLSVPEENNKQPHAE
jgi:DNA-binding Xre family transcriptional regulator